ncbi:MAG: HlyD family secretion protein [Akkermansiaceae bacterium]|nr:HlyD family secretion protein [Akkermansiaceae bacterium]
MLSRLLIIVFIIGMLALFFAPWRQFVKGSGRVTANNPLERRINVEALVPGRMKKLHVAEGQRVKAGDLIAEIQDNDPNLLDNIRNQRNAVNERVGLAQSRVAALEEQMARQQMAKAQALDSARQKINASRIAAETAEMDHSRMTALYGKGLVSRREHEQAILKRDSTTAELIASEANIKQTESEFDSVIAAVGASRDSAKSEIAKAQEELGSLDIRLSQNQRQIVTAPRDGIVLKVPVTDGSYLSPGELICVIIPETQSRFVEIWVDGNDMPLIAPRGKNGDKNRPGSPVRLAFEGWPAVQIIGWPQLAVGTFNGEVVFVDATDDGSGRFRVVVGPADDIVDRGDGKGPVKVGWPSGERWLREGVRAKAWILLEEVPLWFELWRHINGFPAIGNGIKEDLSPIKP